MKNAKQAPDFLCIGFLCHDQIDTGHTLGGTASYASLAAMQMGKKTAILTSVGNDFKFFDMLEKKGIIIKNKKAQKTTVFKNNYKNNIREQFLFARANDLRPMDLPKKWSRTSIVLFSPIADEVNFSFLDLFPQSLKGATMQGWLRKWDKKGKVYPKKMNWKKLKNIDIVFLSKEDIEGKKPYLKKIINQVKIVALTRGKKGATIYYKNKKRDFPAYPAEEIDPTGCGDIFATAFLIKYDKTKNIKLAAAFANAAASLAVEKTGAKVPALKKINKRFKKYQKKFSTLI